MRRPVPTAAAGALLAGSFLLVLHRAFHPAAGDRFVDTEVYRLGARAVLHHHDPYVPVSSHGGLFTYPPLAAYLFTVLLPLGRTAAGPALAVLTVLTAAAVTALCLSRAPAGPARALHAGSRAGAAPAVLPWTLAVTAVCLPLQPLTNTVSFGQIGVLLAGLVSVDLLACTRLPRGVLVGIAAAVKLTPALFLVHLWVSGQRRAAITGAATAAGLTAAAAVFPAASRAYWATALWQTGRIGPSDGPRNRSLWGLTQRLLPDHTAALAVALVTGALLTRWGLVRARRCHHRGDEVTALVVVGCLTCLDSPITWSHHLVWLVLAVGLAIARRGRALLLAPLLLWAVLPYPALFTQTVATQPNVQVLALIAAVLALPGQRPARAKASAGGPAVLGASRHRRGEGAAAHIWLEAR